MQKTMSEPTQTIGALALIRAIRDAQADEIQGMTTEQQIAYYRSKAQEFLQKIGAVPDEEPEMSLTGRYVVPQSAKKVNRRNSRKSNAVAK